MPAGVQQENRNMTIKYKGSRMILIQYLKEINVIFFIRDNNCIEIVHEDGSTFITREVA